MVCNSGSAAITIRTRLPIRAIFRVLRGDMVIFSNTSRREYFADTNPISPYGTSGLPACEGSHYRTSFSRGQAAALRRTGGYANGLPTVVVGPGRGTTATNRPGAVFAPGAADPIVNVTGWLESRPP